MAAIRQKLAHISPDNQQHTQIRKRLGWIQLLLSVYSSYRLMAVFEAKTVVRIMYLNWWV